GRAGPPARHAAKRDTTASTLIHTIVTVCTRWIRRMVSGVAICNTEAIHDIMAPEALDSRSNGRTLLAPYENKGFCVSASSTGAEHSASSFITLLIRVLTAKHRISRASKGFNISLATLTLFIPGSSHRS